MKSINLEKAKEIGALYMIQAARSGSSYSLERHKPLRALIKEMYEKMEAYEVNMCLQDVLETDSPDCRFEADTGELYTDIRQYLDVQKGLIEDLLDRVSRLEEDAE